jgi:hypothetical protein
MVAAPTLVCCTRAVWNDVVLTGFGRVVGGRGARVRWASFSLVLGVSPCKGSEAGSSSRPRGAPTRSGSMTLKMPVLWGERDAEAVKDVVRGGGGAFSLRSWSPLSRGPCAGSATTGWCAVTRGVR